MYRFLQNGTLGNIRDSVILFFIEEKPLIMGFLVLDFDGTGFAYIKCITQAWGLYQLETFRFKMETGRKEGLSDGRKTLVIC